MEILIRDEGPVKIVELVGRLDTTTSPDADAEIDKLILAGAGNIAINLEKLEYLSSSGLRVFLGGVKRMMANGGKVALCNPNALVMEILQHSGFDSILDIKTTLEEALESM